MIPAFSFETPAAVGGNRNLNPERAETSSAAIDFAPSVLNGFQLSLDMFHILVKDPIAIPSVATIYDECYRRSNPTFCSFVSRDPLNGQLVEVLTTYINQSFISTSGVDVSLRQSIGMRESDHLDFDLTSTYLSKFRDRALPSSAVKNHVGYLEAAGGGFPRWRGNLRTSYATNLDHHRFDVSWTARYIGKLKSWRLRDAPTAVNAQPTVPAYQYHDFSLGYNVKSFSLTAGLLNAFDKEAPYYTGAPDTNTDVETYDVVGRRAFVQLKRAF
jgi:outer membrane receptor protein involved in Fe transport